jgi:glyceraldehyde-3-phosphate dehydrogenase/erythrose-4-phosphate dehydrogenase
LGFIAHEVIKENGTFQMSFSSDFFLKIIFNKLGVNEDTLTTEDLAVSNASCTTNCLVPMVKVIG